jgi:uncharacterized protein (TIGR02147 family)
MEKSVSLPLIEKYRDYRRFLRDYYAFKKNHRAGFSFRQFASKAGIKSPNYLQLVMKGERNLSEAMADQVAVAMDLSSAQKKYFVSLVRQENAKTDDELGRAREESLVSLKKLVAKYLNRNKEQVLTEWHYLLIRELVALPDFEPTGEYISEKLRGLITAKQGEKSLRLLIETGFLSEKSGRLEIVDPILDTGDTLFTDELIQKYHAQNLKQWSENLSIWDSRELELGLLNLSLPASKIPELKERMRNFQDQILGWLQESGSADSVVQVGVYMIPHAVKAIAKD